MLSNDRTLPPGPGRATPSAEPPEASMAFERRGGGPVGLLRDWRVVAGIVLVAAGFALQHAQPLDIAVFQAFDRLGPAAPWLWSDLSVAGLGLSTWIYLTFDAQDRPGRVARLLWILVVGGLVIHWIKQGFAKIGRAHV